VIFGKDEHHYGAGIALDAVGGIFFGNRGLQALKEFCAALPGGVRRLLTLLVISDATLPLVLRMVVLSSGPDQSPPLTQTQLAHTLPMIDQLDGQPGLHVWHQLFDTARLATSFVAFPARLVSLLFSHPLSS
jgi:hypothetical protein